FAVLYAFRALYSPTPAATDQQQQQAQATTTDKPSAPATPQTATTPVSSRTEEAPVTPVENVHGEKAEDVTIESPLYIATFSNIGGVLKSYRLKEYKDGEGHPLELINQTASNKVGFPLAIVSGDKAIDDELAKASFASRRDGNSVTFEYAANGLYARKTLVFEQENYVYSSQTVLMKNGMAVPHSLV